jgi:hypothetical protein
MDFSEWKPVDVYYKTDDELKKHNVTKNSAIEKAKKYALSEVAGLSETAKDNIKNKSPYILWTDYPVGFEYEEKPGKIEQRSFVWKTGKKGVLVIVSGIGMPTLEGWLPARVALETRESLLNHNTHIRKAIELSRTFARENPEKLTYKEEQTILTTRPRIYETDFDLKQIREDTTGHKSTYIQKTDEIQWSMVWDSDEKDVDIVVSGKGNEDFSEWKPFIIFLTAEKEIERCILK